MNKSLVQNLLHDNPSDWREVLQAASISVTPDETGRLASLKYDQTESPMNNPLVQQCRGTVVDVESRQVLAWPYDKFWNLGESRAAPVDWETARVLEKLDGSLMIMYWDPRTGMWRVASSGHPTAGGKFGTHESWTFHDAFWSLLYFNGSVPDRDLRDHTFMFELCAPENRVVVRHKHPRLVLHGARDLTTGRERSLDWLQVVADRNGWQVVRSHPISSAEQCVTAARDLQPHESEGFVVVDHYFRRVKVKSPNYVAVHHMKGEFSRRRAVELWQTGETSELVAHFPEFAEIIDDVHARLDKSVRQIWTALTTDPDDTYDPRNWVDRKDFALRTAMQTACPAACFAVWGRDTLTLAELRGVMRGMKTSVLEGLL